MATSMLFKRQYRSYRKLVKVRLEFSFSHLNNCGSVSIGIYTRLVGLNIPIRRFSKKGILNASLYRYVYNDTDKVDEMMI